ncbi:MAG: thioredoxin family protein [Phycisphaerales bacterium]
MTRRSVFGAVAASVAALCLASPALAQADKDKAAAPKPAAKIGEAAPAFELTDLDGKTVKLADFKGKTVVLEWFNPGCPIVVMHYEADTMNKTIAKFKDKNVVWVRINSGAAGKQGADKADNVAAQKEWNITTPILLDDSGTVGKSYGAKTTPHCFVINADGVLAYSGAIDNGSPRKAGDVNYVAAALTSVLAGETVAQAETKPYGCPVKY